MLAFRDVLAAAFACPVDRLEFKEGSVLDVADDRRSSGRIGDDGEEGRSGESSGDANRSPGENGDAGDGGQEGLSADSGLNVALDGEEPPLREAAVDGVDGSDGRALTLPLSESCLGDLTTFERLKLLAFAAMAS